MSGPRGVARPTRIVIPAVVALFASVSGAQIYFTRMDDVHRQAAHRYRTDAVLAEASRLRPNLGKGGAATAGGPRTTIVWTGRDGVRRTGETVVSQDRPSGSHITVWTDSSGALSDPPARRADAVVAGAAAAGASGLATLFGLFGGRAARRVRIARLAAADIDREWKLIAPGRPGRRN